MALQDVAEAIQRLPVHEQDLRLQRLKRATDCSLKKSYLPKDLQKVQTPFNFYIDVSFCRPCILFLLFPTNRAAALAQLNHRDIGSSWISRKEMIW